MRPWQRLVPLAAAVFLAAGVLAVSGRFLRPRRPRSRFRRGWVAGTGFARIRVAAAAGTGVSGRPGWRAVPGCGTASRGGE